MMDLFETLLLSVVEGVTEFLPISSTGHLVLVSRLLGIPQTSFVKSFEIFIQLGAILAVVSLYGGRLLRSPSVFRRVGVAWLPTAGLGLVFYRVVKEVLLGNTMVTLVALVAGGLFLLAWEWFYRKEERPVGRIEEMSLGQAALVGVFQALSMVPGVSRAATTIVGGLVVGLGRTSAVEFSFLLAIPTMAAAAGLDLARNGSQFQGGEWFLLAVGFGGAFVSALVTVRWFLRFIGEHTFVPFGVYRIVVALLFWLAVWPST